MFPITCGGTPGVRIRLNALIAGTARAAGALMKMRMARPRGDVRCGDPGGDGRRESDTGVHAAG